MAANSNVCPTRVKTIQTASEKPTENGTVVYWVTKGQRVENNWSLVFAQNLAIKLKQPLVAIYTLLPAFPRATQRQYTFMVDGLADMRTKLAELDIPFALYKGKMDHGIKKALWGFNCSHLVMDHDVVHLSAGWKESILKDLPKTMSAYTVDGNNVVPAWEVSEKESSESAFRAKIQAKIKEYLVPIPELKKHPYQFDTKGDSKLKAAVEHERMNAFSSADLLKTWYKNFDSRVESVDFKAGQDAGMEFLNQFIAKELPNFAQDRNLTDSVDQLQSYLFWGQISAQTAALTVAKHASEHPKGVEAFLDEFVIRRQFAANRMAHGASDSDESTLYPAFSNEHWHSKHQCNGEAKYTEGQLENRQTDDQVWNAIQKEMMDTGKMCGFAHGYWARKILEWSASPEQAFKTALRFKDKYCLAYRGSYGHNQIDRAMGALSTESVADVERRMQKQFKEERAAYEHRFYQASVTKNAAQHTMSATSQPISA